MYSNTNARVVALVFIGPSKSNSFLSEAKTLFLTLHQHLLASTAAPDGPDALRAWVAPSSHCPSNSPFDSCSRLHQVAREPLGKRCSSTASRDQNEVGAQHQDNVILEPSSARPRRFWPRANRGSTNQQSSLRTRPRRQPGFRRARQVMLRTSGFASIRGTWIAKRQG
jgi:hypothetical protein